jgi:hypothetical protein
MKQQLILAGLTIIPALLTAAPLPPEELQLRNVIEFGTDLGVSSSMFNSRYFDGFVYVDQVNPGTQGLGRYASGWGTALMLLDNRSVLEHRMVAPFRGTNSTTYLIGSSSGATPTTTTFSRYDFQGSNRVDVASPSGQIVEGFDWVDENTIIHTSYTSGNRKNLYLVHVVAEPFALTADTRWNANGYVTTEVSTRIRNVRTGDKYKGYAYYGDNGQNIDPNFYAINLQTGTSTLLGNAGVLTTGPSFGIWTVLERNGYLYVQSTEDGIQVYPMTSATSIGPLLFTYTRDILDTIAVQSGAAYYGLDVWPDGSRFVLGSANGRVIEFGAPEVQINKVDANSVMLSWPSAVTSVAIQSSPTLVPASFVDIEQQPLVTLDGKTNSASVSVSGDQTFFRLRKNP